MSTRLLACEFRSSECGFLVMSGLLKTAGPGRRGRFLISSDVMRCPLPAAFRAMKFVRTSVSECIAPKSPGSTSRLRGGGDSFRCSLAFGRITLAELNPTAKAPALPQHDPVIEAIVAVQESPVTRASLLVRLKDRSNQQAWSEFVELYGPVIYGFARSRGLQDADASDMMQDVLKSVAGAIEGLDYDSTKGSFRGWLFTITRNKVFNHLSSRRGKARASGDSDAYAQLAEFPDSQPGLEADWERDYQRRVTAVAMDRLKSEFQPKTWDAFWRTAVQGEAPASVGVALQMSPGAVYIAKSRVLARLKDEVQTLLAEDEV
jgi:RNA polymerase sigma factor (sigma-70 family)